MTPAHQHPRREPGPRRERGRRILAHVLGVTLIVSVLGIASAGAQAAQDDPAQVEAGMAVFEANCAGCHGTDGTGTNFGRPLTDVATQEPDRSVHIASVTNGKGGMPAFGDELDANDIDAAVSYVRLTFSTAQADDAAEPELAVTGRTTTTLVFFSLIALTSGLGLTALARRTRAEV